MLQCYRKALQFQIYKCFYVVGDYCSSILTNVRECSDRIDVHKKSLQISIDDTETLLETFQKAQKMESKLKSSLLSLGSDDIFSDLLPEDMRQEKKAKDRNDSLSTREPKVRLEDKRKLLETLKAIDNGDSFNSLDGTIQKRNEINEILIDMSK